MTKRRDRGIGSNFETWSDSFLEATMSKRVRIYTAEDVAAHNSQSNCWLSRNGKVYNVSKFIHDHPGGDDIILRYAGKDVKDVMAGKDREKHEHSDAAYDMLEEYQVGKLGTEETILRDGAYFVTLPNCADLMTQTSTLRTISIRRTLIRMRTLKRTSSWT